MNILNLTSIAPPFAIFASSFSPPQWRIIDLVGYDATVISLIGYDGTTLDLVGFDGTLLDLVGDDQ